MSERWYESDNPSRYARHFLLWFLGVMVLGGLISVALWAAGVFTSNIAGRGEAIKTKNSALNRIGAQERFQELFAGVKAADQKVTVSWEALQSNPKDSTLQQNYYGTRNYCISVVADYDANARKYTQQDFRDSDLPFQIDQNSPTSDCKFTKGEQ